MILTPQYYPSGFVREILSVFLLLTVPSESMSHKSIRGLTKISKQSQLLPNDILLKRGATKQKEYWHVHLNKDMCGSETRCGKVEISKNTSELLGLHASINIKINQNYQGRHIGRYAYQIACELSSYDKIYAFIRKSNTASIKAAQAAGFVEDSSISSPQAVMVWSRKQSKIITDDH